MSVTRVADFHERYTISIRDNALASDSFGFTSTYETQFRASVAEMLGQRCRMKFSNATIQPSHQSRTASSFHSVISSLPRRISRGTYIDEVSGPQSRLIRSIGSTGLKGTRLYGGSVGSCLHSASTFLLCHSPWLVRAFFFIQREKSEPDDRLLLSNVYRKPAKKRAKVRYGYRGERTP